jgi:hypothetical protein
MAARPRSGSTPISRMVRGDNGKQSVVLNELGPQELWQQEMDWAEE